jgi:predicted nucleotidyltransferase
MWPVRAATSNREADASAGATAEIPIRPLGYGSGMVDVEVISRAGRILADAAQSPARVILFGSHARGGARYGSDLDFLVIERDVVNRAVEMARLRDALPPLDVPVDVVVVSEAHAAKWGPVKGTMVHAALGEGRLVAES